MKILYYNWDHIDGNIGGGVTVYQKNLVKYLLNGDDEIYFLNSGYSYDGENLKIKSITNSISNQIKTFEIINSPVIAPVQQSIKNIRYYLEDETLYNLLKDFLFENNFDVIHFNNLEGLSLKVLELKKFFPQTKFIYSLHNYFPICTMVTLWNGKNNCHQKNCADCHKYMSYSAVKFLRERFGYFRGASRIAKLYGRFFSDDDDLNLYREFETQNINHINQYIDVTLAVSERVKKIFSGLTNTKVSYIGTNVADRQRFDNCADIFAQPFKIIYMGYMNEPKGFYFFVDSLKKISDELAKKISVTVVARHNKIFHCREIQSLKNLKSKFHSIELINGYNHSEQENLLRDKNLGIVPVLWEDNLPQVAIEQIAYGVPILTSDLGEASELHNHNENFTFKAADTNEFLSKLENIFNNRQLLKNYWQSVKPLTTMKDHVDFLRNIYAIH